METAYRTIAIEKLKKSPLNPRRHVSQAKQAELNESVAKGGIKVPLLVRPNDGFYEIAAGHRRLKAAHAAGLTVVPAIVREMTDPEFLEVLSFENLEREDLHPLDEAAAYKLLMEKAGYDVAAIAAKLGKGKSQSYIYQRLKLAELIPEAQKKFLEDKITAGHAILIARLQPKQQKEALQATFRWQGETIPVRSLGDWIDRNIHLDLNSVSFSKSDPDLVKEAGPCTTCPKRTGFVPQLFPDIQKKDTCTDPQCYHAKVAAFTEKWIREKSEDTDQPPLRLSADYSQERKIEEGKPIPSNVWSEISGPRDRCDSVREGIIVSGRHSVGQTKQVCIDPKCKKHHPRGSGSGSGGGMSAAEREKWQAKQKAEAEKRESQRAVRLHVIDAILAKVKGDLSAEDLSMIVLKQFQDCAEEALLLERHQVKADRRKGWNWSMRAYVAKQGKPELLRLLLEMTLLEHAEFPYGRDDDSLLLTAARYKIDVKKIEKEIAEAAKKKDAAEPPKEKPAETAKKKVHTSAKKRSKK